MPSRDEDFNQIKRELVNKIDNITVFIVGDPTASPPLKGFHERISSLEEFKDDMTKQKDKRDKQIAGVVVLLLTGLVTFLGDMVSRMFFHTK